MRKIAVIVLLLLLATTAYAISITAFITLLKEADRVPLEENLIVVETTPEGIPMEKRMAQEADIFFYRSLKVKVILEEGGTTGYENEFSLNLRNVSGMKLENISLIEMIPKEIVRSALKIDSDENFSILEEDPIIKFSIEELRINGVKELSYRIRGKNKVSEGLFGLMLIPTALIKLEEQSCLSMICNDFNPCTEDICEEGECIFTPLEEGESCEEGKRCIEGECIEAGETDLDKGMPPESIPIIILLILIIVGAIAILIIKKKEGLGEKLKSLQEILLGVGKKEKIKNSKN